MDILDEIRKLKRSHHHSEDLWHSCPLAEFWGSDPEAPEEVCSCGASDHNKRVDAILDYLSSNKQPLG